MRRVLSLIFAICLAGVMHAEAAQLDSIYVFSRKMKREIPVSVITPEAKVADQPLPVIYMLHGYNGSEKTWTKMRGDMLELSDRYQIIFVCPDGENSWYWDSPVLKESQFENFISNELPKYIDATYPTIASREGRAITGNSMGGQGALWNAMRNSKVFGAAGSMSGGLDIRPFPTRWDMALALGEKEQNEARWDEFACISQIKNIKNGDLKLIIDCGVDDFFFEVNNNFHEELVKQGIAHDYIVREGAHTGKYWRNAIYYQIFFFDHFFRQ